ncbi:MAG TPA: YCF48-related protein, partial [Gemmataceae bacterium]|nr:YCF48-related protein [Gemmataceae bacterium]
MRALLITLALFACGQTSRAADLRFASDVTLRAVQFVDDGKEGWAVGDEGVILHTIDGGRTWELQATPARTSLRSLAFLTPYVGWAVGREELPNGRGSAGVLLFTRDGGEKWQRQLAGALPGLNQVKFLDTKTGFIIGDGTEHFATGVFKTSDGGRTWEPVPGPRSASWLAGDFQDAGTGVLAGAWGHLATLRDATFGNGKVDRLDGRSLRGLAILPKQVVAVGQGGLILTSTSGGARWGFAGLDLSEDLRASLDFSAIHAVGSKAWVVGRPGSVVLCSADSGATWKLARTGQSLPLHGVFFLDEKKGWAVGELGTIIATTDGGQSWTTQHQGGKRAAACFVHAQPDDVPVDTLAILGADEGYLLTGLRVIAPNPDPLSPVRATDPMRFAAGWRRAGGAAGEMLWQFPLPQHLARGDAKELLQFWAQNHGIDAGRELPRQLVLAL